MKLKCSGDPSVTVSFTCKSLITTNLFNRLVVHSELCRC